VAAGDQVIQRLIYEIDADLSPYKAKMAEVQKVANDAGAATTASANQAEKAFKSAASGGATELSNKIADIQKAAGATGTTAAEGANKAGQAFRSAASGATEMHRGIEVSRRELIYFGRELATGDFQRLPATFTLLASHMLELSSGTILWGVGLAAIPFALAASAIAAENAISRVRRALMTSGYASGLTSDQVSAIAASDIPGVSTRGGLDIAQTLIARGNVSGAQLPGAIQATSGYAQATGLSQDKAAEAFEKILADPAKGAQELNDQFKLLDYATRDQIRQLQESGDTAKAQQIIIDNVNKRFGKLDEASWSLAKAFGGIGTALSNFWFKTGAAFAAPDKATQMAALQSELSEARKGIGASVSTPYGSVLAPARSVTQILTDIQNLRTEMAKDKAQSDKGGAAAQTDKLLSGAMAVAKGYDAQDEKAEKLKNQLKALDAALGDTTIAHGKYAGKIKDAEAAVKLAIANQLTPAQLAAQNAEDQRKIAATPPAQRPRVEAEIAAQRERQRNLANPETALQAQSIYDSQMAVAGIAKMSEAQDRLAERQAKALEAMKAESDAEIALAKAYDLGSAAVAKQKAVGEAHTAFIKKEISDEKSYAAALQERAFATEAVAVAQKIANDNEQIAGLRAVAAANGDPLAIARAEVETAALLATQKERDNAITADQIALADKSLAQIREELTLKQRLQAENKAASEITAAGRQLGYTGDLLAGMRGGATDEEIQHIKNLNEVTEELIKDGLDPTSIKFMAMRDIMVSLKDSTDEEVLAMEKLKQAAHDMADAITGPLEQLLTSGGSIRKMLESMFKDLGAATIKNFIIEPLNKKLESMIAGWLGGSVGKPGTSPMNPLFVTIVPGVGNILNGQNPGGGGSSIFSGIGSFFASIFGGGRAGGGDIDASKFYLVGEHGPELFAPGVSGAVMANPGTVASLSGGGGNLNITHQMSIVVSGVGDKDLLEKIQTATSAQIANANAEQDKHWKRMQRPALIGAQRRALS